MRNPAAEMSRYNDVGGAPDLGNGGNSQIREAKVMSTGQIHPDERGRREHEAHMSPVTPAEDARTILINRISWGAVFAGVVVALVVQLILNLFGIGLGASTLNPGTGDNPSTTVFSIGAGVWWTVSGLIAAFAGGYTAGRLAGQPIESTAGWHGLTTWALTTIVVFYLLTSAVGSIIGGAYSTLTSAAGAVGGTAGGAVQTFAQAAGPGIAQSSDPFSSIEQSIRSTTGGNDPAALRDAATSAVRAALTGDEAQRQEARERATQAIAKAQNIPSDQARTKVQEYEQKYRQIADQTKEKATQAADVTAKAVSRGALFGAVALLLGAIAGWFGGRAGAIDPTITSGLLRARVGRRRPV
jgi:hypothetical protein